jgi:hypothetical protein
VQRSSEAELLDLQRRAGNAAVTTMVQRDPKDRPASTDNPGAKKKPAKEAPRKAAADITARVLKFEIDSKQALITLSVGSEGGVKLGMAGSLLEKGKEYADFTIDHVSGGSSKAHLSVTQDQVSRGPTAIIKASKFKEESQAGKEF